MGERSTFANVMLFLIAVILVVGFWLTIGVVDLFRQRLESVVTEVRGMRADVARLREAADAGQLSVAAPATPPAPGTPPKAGAPLPKFANMELRDPNAVSGDGMVMAVGADAGNLNNIINNDAAVADYWGHCNDSLADRSFITPDRFEPRLAEKWEISDDKLTYTIHLRRGVLWHNFTDPITQKKFENVEVTAADFKFYVDIIRNPKIDCEPLRNYFEDLDDLKVIDDHTFQVVWRKPYFLSEEITLGLSPLPRHFYVFDPAKPEEFNDNFQRNKMIVGCGPYMMEQWEPGKEITFRRNEDYYGPKPYLKRLTYKVIKEPTARLQALRNGELDRIGLLPEQWVEQTKDEAFGKRFNKFQYPARAYNYIGYNMRREMFSDKRVRLALTHLVDRERILREVYFNLGVITTGPFYVESSAYDKTIQPWPFDIAKARQLLAEAGWTDTNGDGILDKGGKNFEFTFLLVSGSKIYERIAEIMREDCAKAGIVVNINPIEWSVYIKRLEEWNFDVCALGWSLGWDQDPYQLWHSSQADLKKSSNHVGFKNAEADKLIEQARGEFDPEKRNALYHRFDQIVYEEQPYTFLVTPFSLVAQDKRYQNTKIYPLGMDSNVFWVPKDQQKYKD